MSRVLTRAKSRPLSFHQSDQSISLFCSSCRGVARIFIDSDLWTSTREREIRVQTILRFDLMFYLELLGTT